MKDGKHTGERVVGELGSLLMPETSLSSPSDESLLLLLLPLLPLLLLPEELLFGVRCLFGGGLWRGADFFPLPLPFPLFLGRF